MPPSLGSRSVPRLPGGASTLRAAASPAPASRHPSCASVGALRRHRQSGGRLPGKVRTVPRSRPQRADAATGHCCGLLHPAPPKSGGLLLPGRLPGLYWSPGRPRSILSLPPIRLPFPVLPFTPHPHRAFPPAAPPFLAPPSSLLFCRHPTARPSSCPRHDRPAVSGAAPAPPPEPYVAPHGRWSGWPPPTRCCRQPAYWLLLPPRG